MRNAVLLTATLLLALSATASTAQAYLVTYDFDDLTGSAGAGTPLTPQDNWKTVGGNAVVRNDIATFFSGASGNVTYSGLSQNSRINSGNFTYSLRDNEPFVLSFKARQASTTSSFFALGADADANGTLANVANEIGPQFGWLNGDFFIRKASQGTITQVASGLSNNTVGVELRLAVDPLANGGDGAGSLSYRAAGTNDPFTTVAGLQNIDLSLSSMAAGFQTPSTWNGVYIRLGAGGALDDLAIYSAIPEPSTGLLVLAMVGLAARRRRK